MHTAHAGQRGNGKGSAGTGGIIQPLATGKRGMPGGLTMLIEESGTHAARASLSERARRLIL